MSRQRLGLGDATCRWVKGHRSLSGDSRAARFGGSPEAHEAAPSMSRVAGKARHHAITALALSLTIISCIGQAPPRLGHRDVAGGDSGPRLLVVLRPAPPRSPAEVAELLAMAFRLELQALWPMRSLGVDCAVYGGRPGIDLEAMAARLESHPLVDMAQVERRFRLLTGVPRRGSYVHLQSGFHAVRAQEAQRWASGRGVRIAVVDTGMDFTHPDLAAAVVEATSFVESGRRGFTEDAHGTAVAGVIAARSEAGHGIRGVAPAAELVAVRACESLGSGDARCESYALAQAFDHVMLRQPQPHLLNLSLAGPRDELLARLLARAIERGIVIVVAAERLPAEEPSGEDRLSFPASLPGVVAVLAADTRPRPPPGNELTTIGGARLAPGFEILTTAPGGRYSFSSGSSLAAAHVTGAVALLRELAQELSPAEVAELLPAGRMVDVCEAVVRVRGSGSCPPPWTPAAEAPGGGAERMKD